MTTKTVRFAIDLEDRTSGAANAAAASLDNLKDSIDDDVKALRELQKAQRRLKAGGQGASAAAKDLADRITAAKASVAAAQVRYVELGGTFEKTAAKTVQASSRFDQLGAALTSANGPLGGMARGVARLGPLLANPIALVVALAAAFVTLGAAIGAATAALLRFSVAQSDARRSEALQIEGLNTLRRQFGMAAAKVGDFQAAMDRASDSTNLSRATLQTYTRQLSRAGLRGEALTEAVEAMGIAAQVQGERGAARFRALAMQARLTGGSVSDLAESYRNRLGPIARRQMLSLTNQSVRLRRSLDRIFSGLRLEPFLIALDRVLSLLSQSTATGRALRAIAEAIFQPMVDQLARLGPMARRFFQGVVIAALVATIAALRLRNALRDVFGDSDFLQNVDLVEAALYAGVAAMSLVLGVASALAIAFGAVAAAAAAMLAPLAAVPAALFAVAFALGAALSGIVEWFERTDFEALAQSMIDGIVNGLRRGVEAVRGAVRGVASAASETFRSALGIASPSKVFAEFGANISGGVAQGIDAGRRGVDDAVGELVEAPTGGGAGARVSISIGDVSVTAGDTSDPRELAIAFRDELASVLEGVSVELGVLA